MKVKWPTELVEKAEWEIKMFERCSMETCAELVAEVKRLREYERRRNFLDVAHSLCPEVLGPK